VIAGSIGGTALEVVIAVVNVVTMVRMARPHGLEHTK
jgi:hypothetical protein